MSTSASLIKPPGVRDPSRRTISSTLTNDRMTYTHYSQETGGAYTQFTSVIGPGYSNPPHHHTQFVETFTCSSGSLDITLDGKTFTLKPGESATVPIGHVHSLINATDQDVEFVTKLEPGNEGFEQAMYIMHGLANDGLTGPDGIPKNPIVLSVMASMMDTYLAGWFFWFARPLLAGMRRAGQGWGTESSLLEKYWNS